MAIKYGGECTGRICPDDVMLISSLQPDANICSAISTAADDAKVDAIEGKRIKLCMIAGPRRVELRTPARQEAAHDVAVGIKHANGRDVGGGNFLLSARLSQQAFRRKGRRCCIFFLSKDRRINVFVDGP